MRRAVLLGVLVVVLGVGVGITGGAAASPADVNVTYDVTLPEGDADRITLDIEVDDPPLEPIHWTLYGSGFVVEEADGVVLETGTDETEIRSLRFPDHASVRISYDPSEQPINHFQDDYTATEEWALFRVDSETADDTVVNERMAGPGYRGEEYVIAGEHAAAERTVGSQELTVVVPDAVEPSDDIGTIADSFEHTARYLRVDARDDAVLAVVVGDPIRSGGGVADDAPEFWLSDDLGLDWNTLAHEYVHLNQEWQPARSTNWMIEAEARYYQHLLAYKQGHLEHEATGTDGFGAFQAYLTDYQDHEDVTLQDPARWDRYSNYEKGALVIAALDVEIRERTDGEADYRDVMRELNADNRNTVDDLRAALESVAGESIDDVVDTYIAGTGIPEVPDDAGLYETGDPYPDVEYNVTTDIASTANPYADVSGMPVHSGEHIVVTVNVTNEGPDPALYPVMDLQLPDTWEATTATVTGGEAIDPVNHLAETAELAPDETITVETTVGVPEWSSVPRTIESTVSDADGTEDSHSVRVEPLEPIQASLAGTTGTHHPNESIVLDAGESHVPAPPATYEWDLTADGSIDEITTEPTLETDFEPGSREVAVTIRDERNVTRTASTRVNTTDTPVFRLPDRFYLNASEPDDFRADVDNEYGWHIVEWDFGDGITTRGGVNASFNPGLYEVDVSVVDEHGGVNSTSVEVLAVDTPQLFARNPQPVPADRTVPLNAFARNVVGDLEVWWEFDDGTTFEGELGEIDLPPGTHDYTIYAVDEYGNEASANRSVLVSDIPEIEVAGPDEVAATEEVTLSSDIHNEIGQVIVEWRLPEETIRTTDEHRITWEVPAGTHEIEVVAIDEHGATRTETVEITATTDEDATPGFGPLAALGALGGILVYRRWRSN